MTNLLQDLRTTVRGLLRTPGFTTVAVLTLALGIGANVAIFSLVDGVLVRPLPYAEPDRLVSPSKGFLRAEYDMVRERTRAFAALSLHRPGVGFSLSGDGPAERVAGAYVTPDLFATLGVRPALGRGPVAGASAAEAEEGVVLSHALWRQRYGGDAGIVGRRIVVDGAPRSVIGVMPAGFHFPDAGTMLWAPLRIDPTNVGAYWGTWGGHPVGRLAPGATPEQARAELRSLGPELRLANPLWTPGEDYLADMEVVPLRDATVGGVRTLLLLLMGAAACVLLITCANIGNLLLARALTREREMALRAALGASRWRIASQRVVESLALALAGGAGGIALAAWGVPALTRLLPAEVPRLAEVGMDARALAFALAATLATGLAAGIVPTWRAGRADLQASLREGGHGSGTGTRRRRLSSALVTAQIALALVLVTGAGLLIRSFRELVRVDPGFRTEQVVTARISPPQELFGDPARQRAFHAAVLERAAALPGVHAAALTSRLPFGGEGSSAAVFIRGIHTDPRAPLPTFQMRRVTPGLPALMEIPLVRGRALAAEDRAGAPLVALVDEAAAGEFWPDADPVGQVLGFPWIDRWMTIVGVVGSVHDDGLAGERRPTLYVPFDQDPALAATLVLRTTLGTDRLAPPLRALVAEIDPTVPVSHVEGMSALVSRSVATPRASAAVLGGFAALALLLGALGIYALVAYGVSQRTREIGVRIALGAGPGDVLAMVVRQGAVLALLGVAVGIAAALLLTRLLGGLLYGVSATDPLTFAAVPVLLGAVVLLASYLPARRAARVDPVAALRAE